MNFLALSILIGSGTALATPAMTSPELSDRALVDVVTVIDMTPQPAAGQTGNVFLVGFTSVNPDNLMPEIDSQPSDFLQVGDMVREWPVEAQVQLVDGVYYFAFYGNGSFPAMGDPMSKSVQVLAESTTTASFQIELTSGGGPTSEPAPGLQTVSYEVVFELDPPLEDSSDRGNLFLAGFSEIDEEMQMPVRGTQPLDFRTIKMGIKRWPHSTELDLSTDLYYIAMYGSGEFPAPTDRMSPMFQLPAAGGESVVFTIGDPPNREQGNPEGGGEGEMPDPAGPQADGAPPLGNVDHPSGATNTIPLPSPVSEPTSGRLVPLLLGGIVGILALLGCVWTLVIRKRRA